MKKKKDKNHSEEPIRIPVESGEAPGEGRPPPQAREAQAAEGPISESRAAEAEAAETDAPGTEALTVERNDLLARLQRVSADFINYQKRVQRDITEARDFANADLIRELLGVLDDMERALQAARANHSQDDPLLAGMQLVYGKALEVLGRFGLQPIEAQGRPFDPTRHEAMMQQPSAEHQSPTVLSELQRGYELKGRVLRPARVVVSSPPQEGEARGDEHACGGTAEDE